MNEKPILMSAPMVIPTLDDSKKQTRRIIKKLRVRLPQTVRSDAILGLDSTYVPIECKPGVYNATMNRNGAVSVISADGRPLGVKPGEFNIVCPYADGETHLGDYGDGKRRWTITPKDSRLWVRETFMPNPYVSGEYVYRATEADPYRYHTIQTPWKPSIFMPRAASRITLQVTGVRIERLQDISRDDAASEGVDYKTFQTTESAESIVRGHGVHKVDYVAGYKLLWEQINGAGSWALNPFCWVIEFHRVLKQ